MEGIGRDLFKNTVQSYTWRGQKKNENKLKSGQPVSRPRFKPRAVEYEAGEYNA
jgi:hypothetical protein